MEIESKCLESFVAFSGTLVVSDVTLCLTLCFSDSSFRVWLDSSF